MSIEMDGEYYITSVEIPKNNTKDFYVGSFLRKNLRDAM